MINDGIRIEIHRLPSSHCKGSLCACVNNEYAMLGDGTYMADIKGRPAYNVQFLKEEIDFLKKLQFEYTLLSHDESFVHDRQEIIDKLERSYGLREKSNPYITMPYTKNS